ncbi:MAG: Cof-type HAD-IIB family hydrolase [Culicoidibacterales bacterium]
MEQHLIVIDLDGTALQNHHELAPFTLTALHELQNRGHIVMIATGRSYLSSRQFYKQLRELAPISNLNGAIVHHPQVPTFPPLKHFVNAELLKLLWNETLFPQIEIIWLDQQQQAIMSGMNTQIEDLLAEQSFVADIQVKPLSYADLLTAHACTVIVKPGLEASFAEAAKLHFSDKIQLRSWGNQFANFIELFTPTISKASAISHVQNHYQIANTHTIAFGDQLNDIEMLTYVPHSVAMANAVPELKALAFAVTALPNTAGGVGHYLNQYFQLNLD